MNTHSDKSKAVTIEKLDLNKHDLDAVARLIYYTDRPLTDPMFGRDENKAIEIIKRLVKMKNNHFSYRHTYCAMIDGHVAGILIGFDYATKKSIGKKCWLDFWQAFGLFGILPILPAIVLIESVVTSRIAPDGYFINALSVDPSMRSRGIGSLLISHVASISNKIFLDVNICNPKALKLYEQLGFGIIRENIVRFLNKEFGTLAMVKF
jgi:ribosomal protein S18 acetylase RimI-like enzyme